MAIKNKHHEQGRQQKNFQGRGQRKKQDRKIAPLSFSIVYHV